MSTCAMRRRGCVIAASVILTLIFAPAASGSFPGKNGRIIFTGLANGGSIHPVGTDIYSLRSGSRTPLQLTSQRPASDASFSADGETIIFTRLGRCGGRPCESIYRMGQHGGAKRRITDMERYRTVVRDTNPSMSPDGQRIVFERAIGPGRKSRIFVMDQDGSRQRPLTGYYPTRSDGAEPKFSPDGKRIVFSRPEASGVRNLWIMNANGGNARPLTAAAAPDTPEFSPDYSPDGKLITFSRTSGVVQSGVVSVEQDVWVIGVDGSSEVNLTPGALYGADPSFAPDGDEIVFVGSSGEGGAGIYTMGADGSDPKLQSGSSGLASETDPAWQPLPRP